MRKMACNSLLPVLDHVPSSCHHRRLSRCNRPPTAFAHKFTSASSALNGRSKADVLRELNADVAAKIGAGATGSTASAGSVDWAEDWKRVDAKVRRAILILRASLLHDHIVTRQRHATCVLVRH